jgi:hypothetical protein
VLKKGGYTLITTPNPGRWISCINLFLRGNLWGFGKKDYENSGHITPVFDYDFQRLCKEHNFKIIK